MASPPVHLESLKQDLFLEPLGGPEQLESLLQNFPDSIYDKSPSSRFYKFFYSIIGPAGVGQLVRNYFQARLAFLEFNVELFDVEKFYGNPFGFGRIFEEQVVEDVYIPMLPRDWEKIKAQDASYRSRALDFIGAARLGTSPKGMELAAKSGLGSEVEIFERYNWIFDQFSDAPIGVKNYGNTLSLNEFVLIPRPVQGQSEIQQLKFEATTTDGEYVLNFMGHQTEFLSASSNAFDIQGALRDLPSIGPNGVTVTGGPAPFPFNIQFVGPLANDNVEPIRIQRSTLRDANGTLVNAQIVTATEGVRPIDSNQEISDRMLHNMQSALDRLRPVNSFFTLEPAKGIVLNQAFEAHASSTYKEPIRFVTGSLQINWPTNEERFWIRPGIEKASKRPYQADSAHYISFHKIHSVSTGDGLTDSALMIDPNPDSKGIIEGQVNGMYPVEYSSLSGVPRSEPPTNWSSISRKFPNNEIIEIDLGSAKPVNFLSFDINFKPVTVAIEYCVWENGSSKEYQSVLPTDSQFSGFVENYERLRWKNISCQFTDQNGNIPLSRYLKIIVTRLDDSPFNKEYSVMIRSLKAGRNVVL